MDVDAGLRAITLFEGRGQLDHLDHVDLSDARACVGADEGAAIRCVGVTEATLWESAFTTAYDE